MTGGTVNGHLIELLDDWALWRVAAVRGAGLPAGWLDRLTAPGHDGPAGLLGDPLFASALTWQNPGVVAAWMAPLIASGGTGPDVKKVTTLRAGLLARYAQRYCAKNDSIGFFGPVGWAKLTGDDQVEPVVLGGGGIRHGEVFFEHWAVELLARAFESDERVRPHLPVRRHPAVSVEGRLARRPFRPPVELDDAALAVLGQVASGRTAGLIEPEATLLALRDAGVVRIGFTVPVGERPEDALRDQVARIPEPSLREELLGCLDELDEARRAAAKAMTDPVPLAEALRGLEEAFTRRTRRAPRRGKDVGAGRTLVYPDCRRDLDVTIGAPLIDRLAPPLGLLLRSARWLTAQAAEAVQESLAGVYGRLRARSDEVTLADLHFAAAEPLAGGPASPVNEVAHDFRLRWAEIIELATGAGKAPGAEPEEIRLDAAAIADHVAAMFPDPGTAPPWAAARHHSPDLLLARTASGLTWVLGELHVAMNTLESRFFHTLSDDRGELAAATAADMAGGRVVPCYPNGPAVDSRRYPPLAVHVPGRYLYWSFGDDTGAPAGAASLPATGLVVTEDGGGGLLAGPRDGSWRLPVLEFFGEFLSALVVNTFRIRTDDPYEPRLVVDDLVVRRRGWRFTAGEFPTGLLTRGGYRWEVLADRLAGAGLPRHLFATSPLDPKPFYVDLRSPSLVTNLARSWRRLPDGGHVELREMLPGHGDLWLADADGRRYTTEIRMVAVDTRPSARIVPHNGQEAPV
ncbi:lantibiotic dehydratase family protein [Planotetraspora sp. A-T 1434]|uniref:lantibiotic dehydratase family protein n=1 Tax=Planotetraspora sp. A-T 1434 TaxID=2979219 RepID=UPI0021C1E9A2|nr:lantibiotic dehydratase family protein [Planotetraspora sp. A-T 1434]MCT9932200.1 lantibiotic dehydratase family protein [Planotetraspora sp. A-T 1434]